MNWQYPLTYIYNLVYPWHEWLVLACLLAIWGFVLFVTHYNPIERNQRRMRRVAYKLKKPIFSKAKDQGLVLSVHYCICTELFCKKCADEAESTNWSLRA